MAFCQLRCRMNQKQIITRVIKLKLLEKISAGFFVYNFCLDKSKRKYCLKTEITADIVNTQMSGW